MDRYTSHDVSDRLRAHLGVFKTSRGASDTDLVTAGHSDFAGSADYLFVYGAYLSLLMT